MTIGRLPDDGWRKGLVLCIFFAGYTIGQIRLLIFLEPTFVQATPPITRELIALPSLPLPQKQKKRTKRPLITAVTVLIIAGLLTTAWITLTSMRVQQTIYARMIEQKLETTSSRFRVFLQPFGNHLETIEHWEDNGLLKLEDPQHLQQLLQPLVAPSGQVISLYLIPKEGPSFRMMRYEGGWIAGLDNETGKKYRTMPWYENARKEGAESSKEIIWSNYHNLSGVNQSGVVCALGTHQLVIALGLLEGELDNFAHLSPITENGILIRRYKDGKIVWVSPSSDNHMTLTESKDLLTSSQPEHGVIGTALLDWGRQKQPYSQPFSFKYLGKQWWASFYPAKTGNDPGELGLLIPAGDLASRLNATSGWTVGILIGIVVLAMVIVILLAFDYRNKWRKVARRKTIVPDSETEMIGLIAEGESHTLEFKSTMRWNLRADKPGKEIEKAWLKTVAAYLNTDGGNLLIGVDDEGVVLGLAPDKFINEDKLTLHFDNLIKQHIGLEFSQYIHPRFYTLDDLRVLLVSVDRCPEASFFTIGADEEFYIRIGASSRQLSASKIMDYMNERQD